MDAPVRRVRMGATATTREARGDGVVMLRSPHPLGRYPERLTERLEHWARRAPDRVFLAQRDAAGAWRTVGYGAALSLARRLGAALLARGLGPERPLAILSDNDIEHALLGLAALHVGVPYAPISPAYALLSTDFAKLKHVLGLLTPGLVFAADGARYQKAIAAALPRDATLVVTVDPPDGRAVRFGELAATAPTEAVDRAAARVGPDTVAKILFTSGSTGLPKGVINTQRMLCSNQQQILEAMPFLADEPPVLVDWLPWNHTFGGNHNVGLTLYNGGTLYIDEGKPLPGMFEETVRNLREVAPTVYYNVPKGFEMLVPYLEAEPDLRARFFSRLTMTFYAGAGLSQYVWDSLDRLAVATCGERVMMVTGLGATETAPYAICANWETGRSGHIGVPAPGVDLKLAPVGDKLEARVRGPNVFPGYWRQPELTRTCFDDEGFWCMGDAVRFVDPSAPGRGLMFDGRLSEDFKLTSGTWVSVGPLRAAFIQHFAPLVRDVVIAGHDRDDVTALVFPDLAACGALVAGRTPLAPAALVEHPAVRARFQALLDAFAAAATGGARRVVRALLLAEPPSIDSHEMTDKGSINQRAVLANRAAQVAALYAEPPSPPVLVARLPA
ncbi:MAG TPA: feruloyl-CoA synthase [Candidatus Sulfotelmatobacter sp.]|nr:feruloyl-CoA synthase [Candidatus Sulfotelmatobacter sp.]